MSDEAIKNGRKKDGTFAKGWKGGPGRPRKELTIPDLLREVLDEEIDGNTRFGIIMKRVVQKAYEGERWAVEFIANRLEGLPQQKIESTVTNTNPTFIVKDEKHKKEIEKRKDF
jgi:hypothetical protein